MASEWSDAWLYIIGPLVGGVLAAVSYWYLFVEGPGVDEPRRPRPARKGLRQDVNPPRNDFAASGTAACDHYGPGGPSLEPVRPMTALWIVPTASRKVRHETGHLLAELHAVAVADLPLLLQVLRVRDAQAHLHAPDEVERRSTTRPGAAARSCSC